MQHAFATRRQVTETREYTRRSRNMAETNNHKTDAGSATDPDWENRVLCSDESCIGVIGADGRCGVCGQPHVPPKA